MSSLRSFIYLDEYKLYSLSSQVFEGLTEYVIRSSSDTSSEKEEQKGPVGSGRVLADIAQERHGTSERRFLHDHAYALLESHLLKQGMVAEVDGVHLEQALVDIQHRSVVRVKGRASFNDMVYLRRILDEFNKFGEALTYVTTHEQRKKHSELIAEKVREAKSREQKEAVKRELNKLNSVEAIAKGSSLQIDPEFVKRLSYLLEFGYRDQFLLQMSIERDGRPNMVFSSPLNRDLLRESEAAIVSKLSLRTQRDITVVGIPMQYPTGESESETVNSHDEAAKVGSGASPPILKEAVFEATKRFSEIQEQYTGRLKHEVIIDPIAVYVQL